VQAGRRRAPAVERRGRPRPEEGRESGRRAGHRVGESVVSVRWGFWGDFSGWTRADKEGSGVCSSNARLLCNSGPLAVSVFFLHKLACFQRNTPIWYIFRPRIVNLGQRKYKLCFLLLELMANNMFSFALLEYFQYKLRSAYAARASWATACYLRYAWWMMTKFYSSLHKSSEFTIHCTTGPFNRSCADSSRQHQESQIARTKCNATNSRRYTTSSWFFCW
jgi:hypothetical protein